MGPASPRLLVDCSVWWTHCHKAKSSLTFTMLQVLCGDETGLLKLVNVPLDEREDTTVSRFGHQDRSQGVRSLTYCESTGSVHAKTSHVSVLRSNGSLELWDYILQAKEDGEERTLDHIGTLETDIEDPMGCMWIPQVGVLCYGSVGEVRLVGISLDNEEDGDVFVKNQYSIPGPLSACSSTCVDNTVAFGGKENDLKLYDLESGKERWKARNVPHDNLNLRQPIWITSICFLNAAYSLESLASMSSMSSDVGANGHGKRKGKNPSRKDAAEAVDTYSWNNAHIVTGTGYKQVRLYDIKTNARPVLSMDIDNFRITHVSPAVSNDHHIYVGDGGGGLYLYDLRNSRRIGTFKGFDGSVRGLDVSDDKKTMCSVSLDRYLRIHETKNRVLMNDVHLKNRLTAITILHKQDSSLLKKGKEGSKRNKKVRREDDDDGGGGGGEEEEEEEEEESGSESEQSEDAFWDHLQGKGDDNDDDDNEEEDGEEEEEEGGGEDGGEDSDGD
jgi:WD40 repeat protein